MTMRMRRKKNLDFRLENCDRHLLIKEEKGFYSWNESEKYRYLDFKQVFGNDNPVWLDLGAGKGGFAFEIAKRNPDINVLAVEKISNVIIEALERAKEENPDNCMFMNCSAEILGYFIKPHTIDRIFLNFSCPYPKSTYKNRRLTYCRFLDIYKYLLKENGVIRLKTDDADFFSYSVGSFKENGFVVKDITEILGKKNSPDDVLTEYEVMFREMGKTIYGLEARLA